MSEECVIAVYDSLESAQRGVHILDRGDFPSKQVSLIIKGQKEHPEGMEELKMDDDATHDAAVGAGLGAVVGILTGIVVSVITGLGTIFLLGPIGGGILGATTGAFLAGLSGWGVHEEHIHHYQKLIREGKVLVIAHGNPLEVVNADRILKETDPEEIHIYAKTSSEAPELEN